MIYNQHEFTLKTEWGLRGLEELKAVSDVIIIVDILSFSTCVSIATEGGATIFPYRWKDESAITYAKSIGAELANFQRKYTDGYSLSPTSLQHILPETRLVLPSPNGSSLSLATGSIPTLCGSLRNAKAVANYAASLGPNITLIAAGERWPDNSLRPAFEDLLGVGAILSHLTGTFSPESRAALAAFQAHQSGIPAAIRQCSSGKELIERGFAHDLELTSALDVSEQVPVLVNGAYVADFVIT